MRRGELVWKDNCSQHAIGVLFDKAGIDNTKDVFRIVKEYIGENVGTQIVISSTTGYTAKVAEEYFAKNAKVIICKQDMSDEFSMKKAVTEELEKKYTLVDIPLKYLQGIIGNIGTNMLRKISQGVKVCFELMEYLSENDKLAAEGKVIVIAGTLKGADTAMSFTIKSKGVYFVDRILCMPKNC